MDGQIWALKADSLTSPLIVTVTVTEMKKGIEGREGRGVDCVVGITIYFED